jgi:hypothetical protein
LANPWVENIVSSSSVLELLISDTISRPLLNLSDPSTPYTGCVIAISGLNPSLVKGTSKDDGTCSSVFTADCLTEIRSTIYNVASAYSGTPAGSAEHLNCNSLLSAVSLNSTSKCDPHLITEYIGSQFLPNNFTGYPDSACPTVNVGDSNATIGHRAFFSWGDIEETGPDNYTIYDKTVTSHVPVFVATWLKDVSNGTSSVSSSGGGGWADTQIMCIPANDTQPGSRNLTEAQKTQTGAAGKIYGMGMKIFGVVGLTVLFGVLV